MKETVEVASVSHILQTDRPQVIRVLKSLDYVKWFVANRGLDSLLNKFELVCGITFRAVLQIDRSLLELLVWLVLLLLVEILLLLIVSCRR